MGTRDQPYAPAYNGLGIIAYKRNDVASARKNFERAIQLDPADAESQLDLGIICTQSHDIPCARKAFRAFLANAPSSYGNVIPQVKAELAGIGKLNRIVVSATQGRAHHYSCEVGLCVSMLEKIPA